MTVRYCKLRNSVPILPARYQEVAVLAPMLTELAASSAGVATFDGSELIGFLLAMTIADFRGRQAAYTPEWANAAPLARAPAIYECMVATAAAEWYACGSSSFLAALFADSTGAAKTLFRLGFGMLAMGAMRDLSLPPGQHDRFEIRRTTVADLDLLLSLENGLCQHLRQAPTFLLTYEPPTREDLYRHIAAEEQCYLLAYEAGEPVAFMQIGPATQQASTSIRDGGTASITGAYVLPDIRGRGISTALLAHAIDWARAAGYERCGVDFAPTNIEANRFWRRHFVPVSFGVQRLLNMG